jgi:hypothetical protein
VSVLGSGNLGGLRRPNHANLPALGVAALSRARLANFPRLHYAALPAAML